MKKFEKTTYIMNNVFRHCFLIMVLFFILFFPFSSSAEVIINKDNFIDLFPINENIVILAIKDGESEKNFYNGLVENIEKRTENTEIYEQKQETIYKIYAGLPKYYKENEKWYRIKYATTTRENFDKFDLSNSSGFLKNFLLPAFADEYFITNGDGWCSLSDPSWDFVRDNSTADFCYYLYGNDWAGTNYIGWPPGSEKYEELRAFFPADTSAIDDDTTIATATLYFFVNYKQDAENRAFSISKTSQANNYELIIDDYNKFDFLEYSERKDLDDIIENEFNTIELNDFSIINKTGFTFAGLLTNNTLDDDPPTGRGVFQYDASENTNQPYYLIITAGTTTPTTTTPTTTDFLTEETMLFIIIALIVLLNVWLIYNIVYG